MTILILGLAVFIGIHLVPSIPALRSTLVLKMGEGRYKVLFSIVSLAGLIIIIYGMSIAEFQAIRNPPAWSKHFVMMIMLVSFYLLTAADMKTNIKRYVRHPMLLGVLLWSGSHLVANGDLASIILFGSFLAFSVVGMVSANMRGATRQEEVYPVSRDVKSVVFGLAGYAIFIFLVHPYFFGVPIV